ncbi:hypothetical protein GCM10023195_61560 [Actinoallomurus liliacearum]|uniref:PEGA domain-containing protein n=1 Tax=Actinoallomurus liliacearum TaxID=1080073 RepID=A0ABP8TQK6_9ACTN
MSNYSKIFFQRPRWRFRDVFRSYVIDVDGRPQGKLRPGEELSLDVLPGRHLIRARVDWSGSPPQEIIVAHDSQLSVCVEPSGNALQIWKVFMPKGALKLTVEERRLTTLGSFQSPHRSDTR